MTSLTASLSSSGSPIQTTRCPPASGSSLARGIREATHFASSEFTPSLHVTTVGTWIVERISRTSVSNHMRSNASMSPGAAEYRAHLAAHRKSSGSSASCDPRSRDISAHSRA